MNQCGEKVGKKGSEFALIGVCIEEGRCGNTECWNE